MERRWGALRAAAFWAVVALGVLSLAPSTRSKAPSEEAENKRETIVAERETEARWGDAADVKFRTVADDEGTRWANAAALQEATERRAVAATNVENAARLTGEEGQNAPNKGEEKTAQTRRILTDSGELKEIPMIRAEASVEVDDATNAGALNNAWTSVGTGAAAQGGQVSQFAQGSQNIAAAQGGQVSQFAQGSQNVAAAQNGQVSRFVQTAQPLATARSGENARFAQEAQNLATAQNGQDDQNARSTGGAATFAEDDVRGYQAKNALTKEFTPSVPLIPYPIDERRSPIASASYETRAGRPLSLLEQIDAESERIGARVQKSVLAIETVKRAKTKATKTAVETGCGFLFQYNGKAYLATNAHVVKDATSNKSVKIFLPNRATIHPTKIMTCADFDLAALELDAAALPTDGSVALCYFGDSDELQVSNFVGTVGNPFGLRDTVTYGHVSSLQRRKNDFTTDGDQSLQEFIQIDASINPGNSGGPLYNARGEVVGVVAAIATTTGKSEGVAFAIPINLALTVLKSTIDAGGWSRSRMGVELETATRADFQGVDWPIKSGSKIVGVNANSPAERAGLRRGDVVVEFDGKAIEDDVHFARLIAVADVSRTANVKFLRGAQLLQTTARLERSDVK